MPTFLFFRNGTKVDSMRGADENALEEKIKKWYGSEEEAGTPVKGHVSDKMFVLTPTISYLYVLGQERCKYGRIHFRC